jgi:hypothetical protein
VRTFAKVFAILFIVTFPLFLWSFFKLEDLGKVDSVGLWYALYCSGLGAIVASVVFAGTFTIMLHQWRPRRK